MNPNWKTNTIFTGDNLHVMRGMNSESVDLIYLDLPFNSNKQYAAPIGSKAAGAAFKDTWTLSDVDLMEHNRFRDENRGLYALIASSRETHSKGMFSYLMMMSMRLIEMKRILKTTGSIYLHCDYTASHYLKLVMDAVFGKGSFRSDITWRRTNAKGLSFRGYPNNSDSILCFNNGEDYIWNRPYRPHSHEYIENFYRFTDKDGRKYRVSDLTNPNKNRPNLTYEWNGHLRVWRWTKERMKEAHEQGILHYSSTGLASQKRYLDKMKGVPVDTIWDDIKPIQAQSRERTGYPTQKPLALLERIIKASSNRGDIVFDPFCGCATALIAAEGLVREWVGIDISPKALELVKHRMKNDLGILRGQVAIHRNDIPKRTDMGEELKGKALKEHFGVLYGVQRGHCNGCNVHFEDRHLEMDHIISRNLGGTNHVENFQLLCGNCNRRKGTKTQAEFKAELASDKGINTA